MKEIYQKFKTVFFDTTLVINSHILRKSRNFVKIIADKIKIIQRKTFANKCKCFNSNFGM